MPHVILPSVGNEISGITIWEDKDIYPEVRAGSVDYENPEEATVNNNFIVFRNYCNQLRNDLDGLIANIPDASTSQGGKVNIIAQSFGGEKMFEDNAGFGKQSVKDGAAKFFSDQNAFYARLVNSGILTANRDIAFPDKPGTLLVTSDLDAKQDLLTAIMNIQINRSDVITGRIRNAAGSYVDVGVPAGNFSAKLATLPAKTGIIQVTPPSIPTPFNVRITAVRRGIMNVPLDTSVKMAANDPMYARVSVAWCLDGMSGSGDNVDKFTFDSVPAFDLTGYYIYFPQYSRNLKIDSMNGAVATLISEEGLSTAIGAANTGNLPFIHCNAQRYSVVAIPYNNSTLSLDESEVKTKIVELKTDGITATSAVLNLDIGIRYKIMVVAIYGDLYSASGVIPQSSGEWPLVSFGNIDGTDAAIGVESTRAGFVLTITGWTDAQGFIVCYTTDNAGADFNNAAHPKIYRTERVIDIITPDSRSYSIKVRPVIAGQAVGVDKEVRVVSGGGGQLPNDQNLLTIPVNIRTYSGTLAYVDVITESDHLVALSAIKTPAGGATDLTTLPDTIIGSVLKDSAGHEFIISDKLSSNFLLSNPTGVGPYVPAAGAFEINTTERGRVVFYGELKIDYDISLVSFDCDVKVGYNSVAAWYQNGNSATYDSLVVNAADTLFKKDTDIVVALNNDPAGKRTFIIDFFDRGGAPENRGGVTGTIVVFGRPRSKKTEAVQ